MARGRVGALALARTPPRADPARAAPIDPDPDLSLTDIAFAAGFASVRQFNDVMLAEFGCPPSLLRRSLRAGSDPDGRTPGRGAPLVLRLVDREPYAVAAWLRWQEAHAVAGLEEVGVSRRTAGSSGRRRGRRRRADTGVGYLVARLHLDDLGDLTPTVAALRRVADLDADPTDVDSLSEDPHLRDLVQRRPGMRVPGAVDGFEAAVRTVISQQVSLAGARRLTTRLVEFVPASRCRRAPSRPSRRGVSPLPRPARGVRPHRRRADRPTSADDPGRRRLWSLTAAST